MSALMLGEDRRSQIPVTEMKISDAVATDLPAIIEIYNAAIATRMATAQLEPVTLDERRDWLNEHSPDNHPFWVMECNGQVAGWLSLKSFLPRCAYRGTVEVSLYVGEKFRRRGIARRLLEEAVARAHSLKITAMVGLIFAHNQPSLRLFAQLGFKRWGLLPRIARLDGIERDLTIMGRRCGAHPGIATSNAPWLSLEQTTDNQLNECLRLMQVLMDYRHQPIHFQMQKVRHKRSMLHLDVLLLIYHFAKTSNGHVLEVGSFVGGGTIAAAMGIRDSGRPKTLVAIEPGGSIQHKTLGTRNILRDLERNLAKARVAEMVTLIKGYSFSEAAISAVRHALGSGPIGLLVIDADGNAQRDINIYGDCLAEGCWMVIDDYAGPATTLKMAQTRADVDALIAAGSLEALGLYGWGTWVGRWRRSAIAVQ
jgi:L-amino acid N-acyltransferase YncA/predicted O-methyltransferase YrrM